MEALSDFASSNVALNIAAGVLLVVVAGVWFFGPWRNHHKLHERLHTPFSDFEEELRRKYTHSWKLLKRPRHDTHHVHLFTQTFLPNELEPRGVAVYVHGLHDHTSRWVCLPRLLEDGFAVATIDMEGHGRSSGTHGFFTDVDHTVEDMAHFVRDVGDCFDDLPLFLIGGSWGGMLVLLTANLLKERNEHDRVRGLVVQCPLIKVAGDSNPSAAAVQVAKVLKALVPRLPLVPGSAGNSSSPEVAEVNDAIKANDPLVYSGNLRVGTGLALKTACAKLESLLENITHPFILQHGTADRVVAFDGSQELFKRSQSSDKTFKVYEGGQHDLESEPDHISEPVIADYLEWMRERCDTPKKST